MVRQLLTVVLLLWLFVPLLSYAESVRLAGLDRVDVFQDDNKSCGPHSAYRILKYGYGESITYQFLKDRIGTTDFPYDIPILGVHIKGTLLKDSDIGQPPTTLARILREIGYSSAADEGNASDERIKDLLWSGTPVILLLQVDNIVGEDGGTKFSAPALHYWVANGYDLDYLYVLDTSSNAQLRVTWFDLHLLRYFGGKIAGSYSTDFVPGYGQTTKVAVRTLDLTFFDNLFYGAVIDIFASFGANKGSIVSFNKPLDQARVFRDGQRVPVLEVSARWGTRVVSLDGAIDCPGRCSNGFTIGTQVTLKITALPPKATLRRWEGPCQADGNMCAMTISGPAQVQPIIDCAWCVASIQPSINRLLTGSRSTASSTPASRDAIEYFHQGFGHYFVSADAGEIAGLDAGAQSGWARTGESFRVNEVGPGVAPVCRFFSGQAFAPKSSHFYTPIVSECTTVKANPNWVYEQIAFGLVLPAGGFCPAGYSLLYRLYNNGQTGAPNHRYTTKVSIRDQMIGRGFVWEAANTACVPGS